MRVLFVQIKLLLTNSVAVIIENAAPAGYGRVTGQR
jgi:hypothetical protein